MRGGLQVVSSGLEEDSCPFVDYDECLTPAERLLPRRHQPKPGEPQVQSPLCGPSPPHPPSQGSPLSPAFIPPQCPPCYAATLASSLQGHGWLFPLVLHLSPVPDSKIDLSGFW